MKARKFSDEEILKILSAKDDDPILEELKKDAVAVRKEVFGTKVYLRGLIEFSSYCKNDCLYCGLRASNKNAGHYRLSKEEILECAKIGYPLGYRTFVLQSGEDLKYSDDDICDIVRSIKKEFPDCAVTLSIGEKSRETYQKYFDAGADRYLLRHETANIEHYKKLHPENMDLENRKRCLFDLKEIGFQAGANVVMPNLSPKDVRKFYAIYDNKICIGEEASQCFGCLSMRVKSSGYEIVVDRGDFKPLPKEGGDNSGGSNRQLATVIGDLVKK